MHSKNCGLVNPNKADDYVLAESGGMARKNKTRASLPPVVIVNKIL
jgi:hypothetical protein